MVDSFALLFDALYLTFTGQAPVEVWFPLLKDLAMMFIDKVADVLLGVLL